MITEIVWVDPNTGEIVAEGTEGAIGLEEDVTPTDPDGDWLGDWLTKQDAHLTAEEDSIKTQTAMLLRRIKARRARLKFVYEERLKTVVRARLKEQKGKRKTVAFTYGNAGWRSSVAVVVDDEEKALEWAQENCLGAVKKTPDSLLKSKLPKKAKVPGVRREDRNTFSWKGAK